MKPSSRLRAARLLAMLLLAIAWRAESSFAQSAAPGRLLVSEDFSTADEKSYGPSGRDISSSWQAQEGAMTSVYEKGKRPGRAHGEPLSVPLAVRDVRLSWRANFDSDQARLALIIFAEKPEKTGIPVWHIGDINVQLPVAGNVPDENVSIFERDFTTDRNHPRVRNKGVEPSGMFKPFNAWAVGGLFEKRHVPLSEGHWHTFIVESVDTSWTLWVDGKQVLTVPMKHAACQKASAGFLGFGPVVLDDVVVEEL